MEFFPSALTAAESDALADRIETHFIKHGFGGFAAELRSTSAFIGFIGLAIPDFDAAFLRPPSAQGRNPPRSSSLNHKSSKSAGGSPFRLGSGPRYRRRTRRRPLRL
jgi:hypothetical protein